MTLAPMKIVVPIRMRSPNVYEHPMARSRRVNLEHVTVGKCFLIHCPKFKNAWVYDPRVAKRVLLTRVGRSEMDPGDNNNSSMKAVRDAIAKLIGVDDRDPVVTWDYDQRVDDSYAVEITIIAKQETFR